MAEWGPLQPVLALLEAEQNVAEGDADRKQVDAELARALGSEDLVAAVKQASLLQLDAALAHDALAVEHKPLSFFLLLSAKAGKIDHWRARRMAAEAQQEYAASSAHMLQQTAQFFYQVPVAVAAKEIKKVSALCSQYAALAVERQQSVKAIFPLKSFLQRFYQQGHKMLTPLHAQFLYLCLHAKCYFAAMPILDQPLLEIHSQPHLVSCVDFLGYAYYGGVLYVGEKRFQEALDLFLLAITAPAVSLSAFVIEAYKKLVLVTLLQHGETVQLPKYTPFVVSRHVQNHCTAYVDLAAAFVGQRDEAALAELAHKHEDEFAKDGNLGLVKQCVQALKQRKLLQLRNVYATVELAQLSTAAGMEASDAVAAEKMLLQLIAQGEMDAVIDKHKAVLRFVLEDEDEQAGGSVETHGDATQRLQQEMEKLVFVASQLRYMDVELVTSNKFQSRLHKDKDRRTRISMQNQQGDDRGLMLDGASAMDSME